MNIRWAVVLMLLLEIVGLGRAAPVSFKVPGDARSLLLHCWKSSSFDRVDNGGQEVTGGVTRRAALLAHSLEVLLGTTDRTKADLVAFIKNLSDIITDRRWPDWLVK